MSNITDTLRECHRIVWQYRAELESAWPTPTTEDALLFAFTELGEAVDAHLRSKPEYARNRDKDLDVLDELADCAMMLLTAMGPTWTFRFWSRSHISSHQWRSHITYLAACMAMGDQEMATLVRDIATHPGMDLPARLTARLERIKAKRLAVEV